MVSGADLNVLTSRKIRQHLEEKYELDLGVRKEEIDEIVLFSIKQLQRERAGTLLLLLLLLLMLLFLLLSSSPSQRGGGGGGRGGKRKEEEEEEEEFRKRNEGPRGARGLDAIPACYGTTPI